MSKAHIMLDGVRYMLTDLGLYHMATANQMAHAVGQGQTEYKDLTSWSAWVQADWQAGTGMKDPAGGGFLHSEGADTRFPLQVILGPWVEYTGARRTMFQEDYPYYTSYDAGRDDEWRLAFFLKNPPGDSLNGWWLFSRINADSIVASALHPISGDIPGTGGSVIGQREVERDERPSWRGFGGSSSTLGNDRFLAITTYVNQADHDYDLGAFCAPARRPAWVLDGSIWRLLWDPYGLRRVQVVANTDDGHLNMGLDGRRIMYATYANVWVSEDNGLNFAVAGAGPGYTPWDLDGANGAWCMVGPASGVTKIHRSTDNGATWTEVYSISNPLNRGRIEGGGGNTWIACISTGIHRSADNGATWANVHTAGSGNANGSDIATDGAGTWVVSVQNTTMPTSIWRSTDDGATWSSVSLPSAITSVAYAGGVWLAAAYRQFSSSSALARIYRSTDGGATWSTLDIPGSQALYSVADRAWLRGSEAEWLLHAGETVHWRSLDGGLTWETLTSNLAELYGDGIIDQKRPFKTNGAHVWAFMVLRPIGVGISLVVANEQIEPVHLLRTDGIATANGGRLRLAAFDGTVYLLNHGSVYRWNESTSTWGSAVAIGSNPVVDVVAPAEDELWIAFGSAGADVEVMDDTEAFATQTLLKADLFHIGAGYLWRSVGSTLYYSVDGTTWFGPIELYPARYPIRGMAVMEDELHVATDFALYRIAPGDIAQFVTRWGVVDASNGAGMIEYNGALYVPVGQDLIEVGPTGGVRPMGLNQREGLPADRQGRVTALAALNNYLLAAVSPSAADGCASLWAWTGEGWHNLAVFPEGLTVYDLKFQDDTANLWVALGDGDWALPARIRLPNDLTNPAKDARADIRFMPSGWMETDWFYAGVRQNDKDWESVTVFGEGLGADRYAEVYWQADDDTTWQLLGVAQADTTELLWDDLDARPWGKRIRLGVALLTRDGATTPIINAISLKYMTMLHDWFRWTLPISLSGGAESKQQFLDGSVNPRTAEEQRAHLMTLATQVTPIEMVDIDGTAQVVKVLDVTMQPVEYAIKGNRTAIEWRAMVVVENVRKG